ncbi:7tm Odorant receptor [Nesidiocoris tenuis]|uniref:Odorant receptor n=1 Tax=Nesidiocoris tenuis TaxID=355587 RepID=A0ABN7B8Y5_9HEMI|nr:7tm Odorant receptor [Nesidiocoris tenuis]
MVLDLTNPSDKELNRLGFGLKTYKDNYLFTAKIGGLCRWSDLYTLLYFSTMGLSFVLSTIFIVINSFLGEKEVVLELVHFMFLIVNTIAQVAVYNVNQEYYLQLYRAFDKGGFDYGDAVDDETFKDIAEIKKGARDRKSAFGHNFSIMLKVIILVHTLKKPASRLLLGSKHPVDGEDNLIWEAPLGLYMPFANYWTPYIVGVLISTICGVLVAITALATTATYQFICEEILAEYAVVKLTFERCIVRAEHLYRAEGRNSDFNACLRHCVNLSVKHHQEALRLFSIFKKMMHMPLFMAISDGGILLCMSCYLTICDDISMQLRLSMPTLVLSECLLMLIYCDYGEKLSDANASVGDGLYNAEKLPENLILLKPYLVTVKRFTDVPKRLSAGGFSAVNRETFAGVIRAAYSYIGFMLST